MPLPTAVYPFTLAAAPARLRPDSYPVRERVRIRHSDSDGARVSAVGMAHFFEDARVMLLRSLQITPAGRLRGVSRAVTIEHVADATLDDPHLELAAGVAAIGKSSFTYGLAAFQHGRCVALGSAVDVRVVDGHAALIEDEARAALQTRSLPASGVAATPPAPAHPERYGWSLELPTRFADTDLVGHLNNVTMTRYHDNAAHAFIREALGHTVAHGCGHSMRVLRQELSFAQETHFGTPLGLGAAVLAIEPHWFTLATATFQQGMLTTACTAVIACVDQVGRAQVWSDEVVKSLRGHRAA